MAGLAIARSLAIGGTWRARACVRVSVRLRALLPSFAALTACAAAVVAAVAAGGGPATRTPAPRPAQLRSASLPYLGIRCHIANWAGCERIGVAVGLARPAVHVTVQVDGHLVTLSPPSDPGSHLWQGVLSGAGPRHGPLSVHARHGYWYGEPPVSAHVRVTAQFADGTTATRAGVEYLHPGYG